MASTFDENKRMKSDHSSCQSWFQHIGIEKSNNFPYSAKFFSARRNTKTSSKSDDNSDPSTTDQGNGQDSELGEAEPAEDSDPDLHRLQSNWNDLCLVYCDKCSYLYAHPAFMRHKDLRHVKVPDASLYQHRLYTEKTIPEQDHKKKKVKKGRKKIVVSETKTQVETEPTKNNELKFNEVDKLDEKSGPGPGPEMEIGKRREGNGNRKKKRRRATFGAKSKKPKTDPENGRHYRLLGGHSRYAGTFVTAVVDGCTVPLDVSALGNSSNESLENNQSTNSIKVSPEPLLVNNVKNYESKNCLNHQSPHCQIKLHNIFSNDNEILYHNLTHAGSTSKMEMSQNADDERIKLKSHPSVPLSNDCSSGDNLQDVFLETRQNGTPPKRFNGDLKKESAHRISSVKCVENQEQDSIFHKENDAYLEKLGNGCELKSWKTKPVVKLKREQIQEKLINQLASPIYNKCLETIKLEPIKIKKALNSINRVCKTRKLEQFRTFSH